MKDLKENDRYIIELNRHQLELISRCVEDCNRFASGQMELWNTTSEVCDDFVKLKEELEKLQPLITPNLPIGASYSWNGGDCENERQKKFIAETYPIYREIRHFLTKEKGLDNTYSSSTLLCKDSGPLIKIKKKDDTKE